MVHLFVVVCSNDTNNHNNKDLLTGGRGDGIQQREVFSRESFMKNIAKLKTGNEQNLQKVKCLYFKAGLHVRSKYNHKVVYTCDKHKHKVTRAGPVN